MPSTPTPPPASTTCPCCTRPWAGRPGEAEPLLQRALAIREAALGAEHPDTATSLNNLAGLYQDLGRPGEAEPLMQRALAIREAALGADHPSTHTVRENWATLRQRLPALPPDRGTAP